MKNTIENYYKRVREEAPDLFKNESELHSRVCLDISMQFGNGYYPVSCTEMIDFEPFIAEFGFELPDEIKDYMCFYWHTYISGYVKEYRLGDLVLFPVLKLENDSADEVLFYENGVIGLTKKWYGVSDEKGYVAIGWLGYSGGYILYNVKSHEIYLEDTGADVDGLVEKKPIAGSLKELINKLSLTGDVWKD